MKTFEPETPLPNWPDSHARVEAAPDEADECVHVRIHGVSHYLHDTTAAELCKALRRYLGQRFVCFDPEHDSGCTCRLPPEGFLPPGGF
jgi:hypothetical protein